MSQKEENCKEGVCTLPPKNPNNSQKEQEESKNPQNFNELQNLTLNDHTGKSHTLKDIYQQKPTAFLFIRHFLCFVCRDQVQEIAQLNKQALEKYNVQLKIVGCGNVEGLNNFAKDTGFPKEQIYVDTKAKIYHALNLNVAKGFNELKDKQGKEIKTNMFSGFFWYFKNRLFRGNQGNVYQMGGLFLVDTQGQLLLQHRDKYTNDYYDMNQFINTDIPKIMEKK